MEETDLQRGTFHLGSYIMQRKEWEAVHILQASGGRRHLRGEVSILLIL